jgi:low affinity Fe/Cu permease
MAIEKLPGWTYYIIVGLSTITLLSLGVNGTLLTRDRDNINKMIEEQKTVSAAINSIVTLQTKTINNQNRILDRICGLLPLDYKQRTDHLRRFPLTAPEDIK